MPTRIVTYAHRYKRPPQKKAAPLQAPTIVRSGRKRADVPVTHPVPVANDDRKPAIVTAGRPGRPDVPDMTPEEHQRRGDAAGALWRELVRRATEE